MLDLNEYIPFVNFRVITTGEVRFVMLDLR
jgi:hypothetical protein